MRLYQTRIVSSTTDERVQHYYLDQLNGVTSMRVVGVFNGNDEGGAGTLTIALNDNPVATYAIGAGGPRAWTFVSAPIGVIGTWHVDVSVRAASANSPVIVRQLNAEF